MSFRLFPLSFREFLFFKGFDYSEPLTEARRGRLRGFLEKYVRYGGFPGIVDSSELIKIRTLQEYLDLIVYRDLVERYGVEKTRAMKALMRVVVRNFARKISIRKLNGLLASTGTKLSRPTTSEYFSYLEDVGFVIPIRKYHPSEVESLRSTPKIYLADTGFASAFGVEDKEYRIENIVAVELLRRKHYFEPRLEVHYWDDGRGEVDFVVSKGFNVVELIQVSYDVDDTATMNREIKALLRASESLSYKKLTVVTWDYEDIHQVGRKTIRFVLLWRWLLEKPFYY
ncbi:ATP-binding protein [Thermococcus thioreducens]|uniref:ATP-binding protein n=1 Tax=Thermococcus thioreducens TaxID=277988 RepID=UPI000A4047BF|nr:ATP-binding protein [Thermococcus thioreducens]